LRALIREGKFREDLFFRLAGLSIAMPALRDRREDLASLIAAELTEASRAFEKPIRTIHPAAMDLLLAYAWPGNLRELHHTMRTIVLFCEGTEVQSEHIAFQPDLFDPANGELESTTRSTRTARPAPQHPGEMQLNAAVLSHVRRVYESNGCNQRQTAKLLGISRARLARYLKSMASN
jgi:two-component system response regulator AtoC